MPIQQITDRYLIPEPGTIFRRVTPEKYSYDFLESSELYFSKVSTFPKIDEVMFSIRDREFMREEHRKTGALNWKETAEKEMDNYELAKGFTYINCWNNDKNEVRSLWHTYAPENGICAITRYEKMFTAMDNSIHPVQIAKVFYFDGVSGSIGIYNSIRFFCRKLKDFRNENESRILIQLPRHSTHPDFIRVKININELIDSIVLSPHRSDAFKEKIESIMKDKKITVPLFESTLRKTFYTV